ncbi:MAG: HAMP domain-containing sensor histidine kinase [Bacteroidales bacterium]
MRDCLQKEISECNKQTNNKKIQGQEIASDFEYARARLVDIIRMIMLTTEMEAKIEEPELLEIAGINIQEGPANIKDKDDSITREKLYTILAHDLKTPVNSIRVMLDFLTNEPELLDKKSSKELLMSVRESAHLIHELLDNFLFWTRMHKHDINFNPVRLKLSHVIRENITLLKSVALNKKISMLNRVDENIVVFADEYMLTTVIRNLIYNAIKFTRKGGEITICANESNDTVEISVRDNGIGIVDVDLDKLFKTDVYFSTKGTMKESGTGLGLILCKDFIEKMAARFMWIANREKAARFGLPFPAGKNYP